MFPLQLYNPVGNFVNQIKDEIRKVFDDFPWWLEWIGDILAWFLNIVSFLWKFFPFGLTMMDGDMVTPIDESMMVVTVTRNRQEKDLGVWKFQYGDAGDIRAQAWSHDFGEHNRQSPYSSTCKSAGVCYETIEPTFLNPGSLWDQIESIWTGDWDWTLFDTEKHLFETELTHVY